MRVRSEHEDECCVMLELVGEEAQARAQEIEASFIREASMRVSKGAKPDYVCLGCLPVVLSKGVVSIPELTRHFKALIYNMDS